MPESDDASGARGPTDPWDWQALVEEENAYLAARGHARPLVQPGQAAGSGDRMATTPAAAPAAAGPTFLDAQDPVAAGTATSSAAANQDLPPMGPEPFMKAAPDTEMRHLDQGGLPLCKYTKHKLEDQGVPERERPQTRT